MSVRQQRRAAQNRKRWSEIVEKVKTTEVGVVPKEINETVHRVLAEYF